MKILCRLYQYVFCEIKIVLQAMKCTRQKLGAQLLASLSEDFLYLQLKLDIYCTYMNKKTQTHFFLNVQS